MHKDNCQMRRETFKFRDQVWLILEIWQYVQMMAHGHDVDTRYFKQNTFQKIYPVLTRHDFANLQYRQSASGPRHYDN